MSYQRGRGSRSFSAAPRRDRHSGPVIPRRNYHEGLEATAFTTLSKPSASALTDEDIQITDLQYLASYNWVEADKPTIIVPGSPREWIDKPLPFRVPRDAGIMFKDQNGYRVPNAVLLPLFKSADIIAEETGNAPIDWTTVDFITDRNGLRKLLRWVNNTADKTFRIDMQLAGKRTVLLNRWEDATQEPGNGAFGFGFEKAATEAAPGCEKSTGHHRIVTYDLNGLKMVVRFEVDACLPPPPAVASSPSATKAISPDDLLDTLSEMRIGSRLHKPSKVSKDPTGLAIIHAGSADIAQDRIIELVTRSELNAATYNWVEQYPQLFLSETHNHYLAVHKSGTFSRIVKRQIHTPDMYKVERDAQEDLKKLRKVLENIQDMVMESGETGRLTLLFEDDTLKVFKRRSTASCIPDEVMKRFEN